MVTKEQKKEVNFRIPKPPPQKEWPDYKNPAFITDNNNNHELCPVKLHEQVMKIDKEFRLSHGGKMVMRVEQKRFLVHFYNTSYEKTIFGQLSRYADKPDWFRKKDWCSKVQSRTEATRQMAWEGSSLFDRPDGSGIHPYLHILKGDEFYVCDDVILGYYQYDVSATAMETATHHHFFNMLGKKYCGTLAHAKLGGGADFILSGL